MMIKILIYEIKQKKGNTYYFWLSAGRTALNSGYMVADRLGCVLSRKPTITGF
ncbi:MAG: hypothetical protein WAT91_15990 [Saprospiraceae bacterium]